MRDTSLAPLIDENRTLLAQLHDLVDLVDDATYRTPAPDLGCSSIGEHVRHLLEFYQLLLVTTTDVDYDQRHRQAIVENCRRSAKRRIIDLRERLESMVRAGRGAHVPVRVSHDADTAGGARRVTLESSLGRELAFVAVHALHHMALIGVVARHVGVAPPAEFGVARATRVFRQYRDEAASLPAADHAAAATG